MSKIKRGRKPKMVKRFLLYDFDTLMNMGLTRNKEGQRKGLYTKWDCPCYMDKFDKDLLRKYGGKCYPIKKVSEYDDYWNSHLYEIPYKDMWGYERWIKIHPAWGEVVEVKDDTKRKPVRRR